MTTPDDSTPLGEARDWLRERVDEGHDCPLCGQFAKVYRRKIHSTMARDLIRLYQRQGMQYAHVATSLIDSGRGIHIGDFPKLAHWGLIAEEPIRREDGGRAGWWRITDEGRAFIRGVRTVPKYALIYDSRVLGFEGDQVDIHQALGDKFDYHELMRGGVYE